MHCRLINVLNHFPFKEIHLEWLYRRIWGLIVLNEVE